MRILVIAAHPDDEILGVGGALLKHKASGDQIYVCMATRAYEPQWPKDYIFNKLKEQQKVDKLMGIKERFNLDLPTVKLNTLAHGEINRKIGKIVEKVNPQVIYTHFESDLHYDHTLIFRASLVAARPPRKIRILCFETLSETEWSHRVFAPNFWVDIGKVMQKKINAFEIYKSEIRPLPHPRNSKGLKILARKRGLEIGVKYAEAFMLIREIW